MKSPGPYPGVTAVILNYNKPDDTIACVESLQNCEYNNLSLVVVDNCSTDGSFEILRESLQEVDVIQTDSNLGFAGGNNVGIRRAMRNEPAYVLIINNDTVVTPGFLQPLVASSEADKSIAIAGGTICYHSDTRRIWYAGGEFVWWRGSSFTRHVGEDIVVIHHAATSEVSFVTGCLMLIRTEAMRSVGMFDERFFMYSEDAELSLRYRRVGYRLVYIPESVIYHKIQHHGDTAFTMYFGVRNRLLLIHLALTGVKKTISFVYLHVIFMAKGIWWIASKPTLANAVARGIYDFWIKNLAFGSGPEFLQKVTMDDKKLHRLPG
jgi:GT2 family glycosyltransferase